jgi:microcystin-dependent protein
MQKIDFVNAQEPAINDTNLNQMQLNIENAINAQVSGDTLPVGCIVPFTSDVVPENWLLCNGQAVSRTDYALLFSIIGTTYGVGDGSTTFNLPDLRGRVAVGKDGTQTEFDNLGEKGGEKTHQLTVGELPKHTPKVKYLGEHGTGLNSGPYGYKLSYTLGCDESLTTEQIGNDEPHNILQPYQVTNYIIKARQSSGIVATVVDGLNSTSTTDALSANQGKVLNEKMFPMEILANNYNIDNIKKLGFYGIFNATGTLPTGYSTSDNNIFIESIMWSSDSGRQILHDVRTKNTYIRNLSANSWSSWSQIV